MNQELNALYQKIRAGGLSQGERLLISQEINEIVHDLRINSIPELIEAMGQENWQWLNNRSNHNAS